VDARNQEGDRLAHRGDTERSQMSPGARLIQRAAGPLLVFAAVAVVATVSAGWGKHEERSRHPHPQPAFYLTGANHTDLKRQAYAAGARFARSQGPGRSVLVLDFGAARLRHDGTYGAVLRSGTFFSNEEIHDALQAAARGLEDHRRRGTVTIVYANTNAFLGRPGKGYRAFDVHTARRAGKKQAKAVAGLRLSRRQSASVGGDIEPGFDRVARPEVSIAMVAGAASASKEPYFNVGTAPCEGDRCTNGWTPRDICEVASGRGRVALPEIYFDRPAINQPRQWAQIKKRCKIDRFAGVSSSRVGSFSPRRSWNELRRQTRARVDSVIVVWPG
jgi:hypothetical protein